MREQPVLALNAPRASNFCRPLICSSRFRLTIAIKNDIRSPGAVVRGNATRPLPQQAARKKRKKQKMRKKRICS